MAEDVLEIYQDFKPDLIVVDLAHLGGRLATDVLGIPNVTCSWGYEADMDFSYTVDLFDELRATLGLNRARCRPRTSRVALAAPPCCPSVGVRERAAGQPDHASLCDGAL